MKKVLIGLTALTMATSVMAAGRTVVETRVGGSFAGAYKAGTAIDTPMGKANLWDKKTSGIGYEVAIEGSHEVMDNFFVGVGIAYQDHAKSKEALTSDVRTDNFPDDNIGKAQIFKSVPVYLTAKYQFDMGSEFVPFVKANLGYSFNLKGDSLVGEMTFDNGVIPKSEKQSMENGLYYSIGAGVDYHNFVVDLSYQVNQGKVKTESFGKLKADHSRVTLGLGYRFDL